MGASATPAGSPAAPPGPLPPNASRVQAVVVRYSVLDSTLIGLHPQRTLYALTLDVLRAAPAKRTVPLPSFVSRGDQIEAFARETLPVELFGQTVELVVQKLGTVVEARFWILGELSVINQE